MSILISSYFTCFVQQQNFSLPQKESNSLNSAALLPPLAKNGNKYELLKFLLWRADR